MPRTQRTRARARVKRARKTISHAGHTSDDNQTSVLEMIRNRRYVAFVRAIVGAARLRNSSR